MARDAVRISAGLKQREGSKVFRGGSDFKKRIFFKGTKLGILLKTKKGAYKKGPKRTENEPSQAIENTSQPNKRTENQASQIIENNR